ncbi:histidine kinase [Paenibacillus filicis]|uniref:histidine kinase n=1 Tax=Paenibacillus filicis TaxID=669464 RepID=A0ABU9DL07_9BACL
MWEYVRHSFLLPYVSMDLGNWLAPLLVFLVTMTLLRKLFAMMESLQEDLQKERAAKAALEEREHIARELHDGIAQSLFLLSVRVDRVEQTHKGILTEALRETYQSLRKTVYEVNEYVRQAIAGLRYPVNPASMPWMESIYNLVEEFRHDTGISVHVSWSLTESRLTMKEKVELYSTIREAMINVYKHAQASTIWIEGRDAGQEGWRCEVKDDGQGFLPDINQESTGGFGLMMIRERAVTLQWSFEIRQESQHTLVIIGKEGKQ